MRAAEAAGFQKHYGEHLAVRLDVIDRIRELTDTMLKASDITAQRVMLELGRVAFADVRKVFDERGQLIPIHELDDDAAASIAGIEHETKTHRSQDRMTMNLATGEMEPEVVSIETRTTKIKRFNKDAALGTLAKHFKLIGDEGDGVNALASALADRLKMARKRAPLVEEVPNSRQIVDSSQPEDDLT